ncbi:MAG: branched-chain amino acid ABC transporter permease [Proteobacteria bacterium]|nr:branched-chain amino acid ABC transporter permease [Pseudomonadota bacterium]
MKPDSKSLWTAAVVALLAAVPALFPGYQTSLATLTLIYALLAMSVDILAGYAGRTPLCHGAIFGAATYVVMYYVTSAGGNPWIGVALGIATAVAVSLVFALLAVRTTGVYFLLLTLALGMVVWGVCQRWTSVTGGENGLRGNARPEWLSDPVRFYYFVLVIGLLASFVMWRFVRSPFGLALKGIRESESRMRSLGYNTTAHLLLGFLFSGLMAGISGVLYAFFNSFVSPSTVALAQSVKGLLMAIIGGVGTLFGGVVGAGIIILLENVVSSYTERWSMVLGLLFVLTMIFAPEGIVGKIRSLLGRRKTTKNQVSTQPA